MEKTVELRALEDEVIHRRGRTVSDPKAASFDRDRYELARAGKQQVLKVSGTLPRILRLSVNAA
jgi:choline transport protein